MLMKKLFTSILAAVVIVASGFFIPTQAVAQESTTISGVDHIELAVKVSQQGWESADTVIIAPIIPLWDALAVAPLAKQLDAPILLSHYQYLDGDVQGEIRRLQPKRVIVVGYLSEDVVKQLRYGTTFDYLIPHSTPFAENVEVLRGYDRTDTAKLINDQIASPKGNVIVGSVEDAVSMAPIAAKNGWTIQPTNPDGTVKEFSAILSYAPAEEQSGQQSGASKPAGPARYIVGGTAVVPNDIPGYERIAGVDRYDTNRKILDKFSDQGFSKVYISEGYDRDHLAPALAAAGLAARENAAMVLTPNNSPVPTEVLPDPSIPQVHLNLYEDPTYLSEKPSEYPKTPQGWLAWKPEWCDPDDVSMLGKSREWLKGRASSLAYVRGGEITNPEILAEARKYVQLSRDLNHIYGWCPINLTSATHNQMMHSINNANAFLKEIDAGVYGPLP